MHEKKRRRAYTPVMMAQILKNADAMDKEFDRHFSSVFAIKLLLFTGNRPTAVFNA